MDGDHIPEEDYPEAVYIEQPEESYTPEPEWVPPEGSGETDQEGQPDQEEISAAPSPDEDMQERIDGLLSQIGAGQPYGSMGDYYVPAAGCYAFPGEDVFFHFIEEPERPGWTAASNGCFVPADSLDAYEFYLGSGSREGDAEESTGDMEGEEPSPPPVSQEDISGLLASLTEIYGQDASYYETAVLHMETADTAFKDMQSCLANILVTDLVVCFFLALLCGAKFADIFFSRMRAG